MVEQNQGSCAHGLQEQQTLLCECPAVRCRLPAPPARPAHAMRAKLLLHSIETGVTFQMRSEGRFHILTKCTLWSFLLG